MRFQVDFLQFFNTFWGISPYDFGDTQKHLKLFHPRWRALEDGTDSNADCIPHTKEVTLEEWLKNFNLFEGLTLKEWLINFNQTQPNLP